MIDHTTCGHDRTSRDRAECRRARADIVDRLARLAPGERNLIEVVLDMADADTIDAPARHLLDEAAARATRPVTGRDEVHVIAGPDRLATVGDLLDHLSAYRRDRPLLLATAEGAGWLDRVRDDHTGSVDLMTAGVQATS